MILPENPTAEEYRAAAHYWQKKWDESEAELRRFQDFLALVMHNFDGMARGQLWQQYREQFPGAYENSSARCP